MVSISPGSNGLFTDIEFLKLWCDKKYYFNIFLNK